MSDTASEHDTSHAWFLTRRDLLFKTILVEGGLALTAICLGWWPGPDAWKPFAWSWAAVGWGCLFAVPPLLALLVIDLFPIGPLRKVQEISEQFLRPMLRPCKWPDYFLLAALAGFCEELLFRGWLQPFAAQWLPMWASNLVVGFFFACCHAITPAYFIIAWLISLYLGGILIWTDNLLAPMVTHGVYDLVAIFAVMTPWKKEKDGHLGGERPVQSEQGGKERGEQAEEIQTGSLAGEASAGNGDAHSAWRIGTPGEESTDSKGAQ